MESSTVASTSDLLEATCKLQDQYPGEKKFKGRNKLKEYRLTGTPNRLKDVFDLLLKKTSHVDNRKDRDLIWITNEAFVCGYEKLFRPIKSDMYFKIGVPNDNILMPSEDFLHIFSKTPQDALQGLVVLLNLPDEEFPSMWITAIQNVVVQDSVLKNAFLQMFRHAKRRIVFQKWRFNTSQSRLLVTSEHGADIGFAECKFEDNGDVFWQACRERANNGPVLKLSFMYTFPFKGKSLKEKMSLCNVDSMSLEQIILNVEQSKAVALIGTKNLKFYECELQDGGAALLESVKAGHGPKGLTVSCVMQEFDPFDSQERWLLFLDALHDNEYMESVEIFSWAEFPLELAAAIRANRRLTHFGYSLGNFPDESWNQFLEAVSTHPSLRSLGLKSDFSTKKLDADAYKALGDMLRSNSLLEEIKVPSSISDNIIWKTRIGPKLEINKYKGRLLEIQSVAPSSLHAALVARALTRFSSNLSMVWTILSQNAVILGNESSCSSLLRRRQEQTLCESNKKPR